MTAETLHLRPAAGRRVRHPDSGEVIGPEGAHLVRDSFTLRRLADGDLEEIPAEAAEAPATPASRRK